MCNNGKKRALSSDLVNVATSCVYLVKITHEILILNWSKLFIYLSDSHIYLPLIFSLLTHPSRLDNTA